MTRNEELLARLLLCVEHGRRVVLREETILAMAQIIQEASGQPCDPGGAIELANRIAEGLVLPGDDEPGRGGVMDVRQIVALYLLENGFHGLAGDHCGCGLTDLMPCDGPQGRCEPGHVVPCDCEEGCTDTMIATSGYVKEAS